MGRFLKKIRRLFSSCILTTIPTILFPECSNPVYVDCLKPTENIPELMCAKCSMECHRRKRIRRTVSDGSGDNDFDMNVSPPCDFDRDDVAGDNKYDLQTEVDLLSKIQHLNINTLLGYCVHDETKLLIYELMHNGSLETYLHGERETLKLRLSCHHEQICII